MTHSSLAPVYTALLIQISIRILDATYLDLNPDPDLDTNPHLDVDSIRIGPHLFIHKVDLYPDTDLDHRCSVNGALEAILWQTNSIHLSYRRTEVV